MPLPSRPKRPMAPRAARPLPRPLLSPVRRPSSCNLPLLLPVQTLRIIHVLARTSSPPCFTEAVPVDKERALARSFRESAPWRVLVGTWPVCLFQRHLQATRPYPTIWMFLFAPCLLHALIVPCVFVLHVPCSRNCCVYLCPWFGAGLHTLISGSLAGGQFDFYITFTMGHLCCSFPFGICMECMHMYGISPFSIFLFTWVLYDFAL